MKKTKCILLVVLLLGFVTTIQAQRRARGVVPITNGIGVEGGITQFDILTDNFETEAGNGWLIGGSATVDIPHKWYNVSYTIQLSENRIGIGARPFVSATNTEFIDYKMFTAQITLKAHIKLIQSFLTIDVGPMLQYNSELELREDRYENYVVMGYENLLAKDITDISKFNFNGVIGVSAGISHFRLKAQYIYGFTNMLNKLNKNNLDVGSNTEKFKGNMSLLAFTLMISF